MKTNRQIMQYLEGCSKEGISYWSGTSNTHKSQFGYISPNSVGSVAGAENISKLRHLEDFSNQNVSLLGISLDSPYRNMYMRFKKMQENNFHVSQASVDKTAQFGEIKTNTYSPNSKSDKINKVQDFDKRDYALSPVEFGEVLGEHEELGGMNSLDNEVSEMMGSLSSNASDIQLNTNYKIKKF
jgi:hypothetical protein